MREIVGDRSGARAFVANDPEVVQIERAVLEAKRGAGFIHPRAAETRSLRRDRAVAHPRFGIATWPAHREPNGRRPAPFPFCEKAAKLRRSESAENNGIDRALHVESKIVWRIEQIAAQLAGFMSNTQLTDHAPLAVPRKIPGEL